MSICLLTTKTASAQKERENRYEKGILTKGQKTGIWEYFGYTPSGEKVVLQRYDHDRNRLLYFRPGPDVMYHAEVSPGKWSYVRPDQPVFFIGGDAALAEFTSKLTYPAAAQASNIQGKVVVGFLIDTLGHTSKHHLVQRIGGGCDEEALRIARTVPSSGYRPAWAAGPCPWSTSCRSTSSSGSRKAPGAVCWRHENCFFRPAGWPGSSRCA